MKILGIETSCDETAAAIVENGTKVLANVIASQVQLHRKTGGVVPEVAAREHVLKIIPILKKALQTARLKLRDIDAIAVTRGPGLLSSLIIGTSAASALALSEKKPLIPVNHIAGHIYANWLGESANDPIQFPLVVLTVSGGHNELVLIREHFDFQVLGETLDDAAGEAFDKVARLLGLKYPGGPEISRAALKGDKTRFKFPKAYLHAGSYDFSFSGLKTAVLNLVHARFQTHGRLDQPFIADCSASFQEAVCEILSDKLLRAVQEFQAQEVHLAGGVSANQRLRELVSEKIEQGYFHDMKGKKVNLSHRPRLRYPENLSYCTDNAAMIAGAAFFQYQKAPQKYLKNLMVLAECSFELKINN
jgi:N6-L-threonylcarbamoyladenine synthase